MRSAAVEPPAPGAIVEGFARLFPLSIQRDEKAMEALGALIGYAFRGLGFKVQGEE